MSEPHFFALIIGSEILNRRRNDAHFDFLTKALEVKGYTLSGSFIIKDDPELIVRTIAFIASDPHAVLFCFGGIGSTPDDHTRKCASIALRDGTLPLHEEAKQIIVDTLGDNAYPYSVRMAELPQGAKLLHNPVNNMPAFSLDDRFYFMPGFPQMSHPMVKTILDTLIPIKRNSYRYTLTAACKENLFIEIMKQTPKGVEASSLPKLNPDGWEVSISVVSRDENAANDAFGRYIALLQSKNIPYTLNDESSIQI